MMPLFGIAVRVVAAYLYLLAILRLSGKRGIAQGTPFDFVVALILGDMIDDMVWAEVPAARFFIATAVIVFCHVVVSLIACRSPVFYRLVNGTGVPLWQRNAALEREMAKERLNLDEICNALRKEKIADMRNVKTAGLEMSGNVTMQPHDWARQAQKRDRERLAGRER